MYWYIWWGASAFLLLSALIDAFVISKLRYKRKRILTPNKMLILGTFASSTILLCPIYLEIFSDSIWWVEWGKSILISMQHAIRLFAFDGDYLDVVQGVQSLPQNVPMLYSGLGAFLYFFAPLLTFGFILSFFQNFSAYRTYLFSFFKHTHVFSELNEKSLALAKSMDDTYNKTGKGKKRRYKLWRGALIVFTDVLKKDDEKSLELLEEAKEIGAILFSKDLESIPFRRKHSLRRVSFYLISEDEQEKIRHAQSMMKEYDLRGVELRVFSDDIRGELLLAVKNVKNIKVYRVNDVQSLIYHNLDLHGIHLFENANRVGDTEKVISAVIVGLGKYGIEMLKALTWYCQLPHYRIKIHAFDISEQAEDEFCQLCPELMSETFNGKDIPGEARYEIKIRSGIDVKSKQFADEFSKITDATYVFVCLGNDADNLRTAVMLRTLCERIPYADNPRGPNIETVIYDSNIRNLMGMKWTEDVNRSGVTNFNGDEYRLHMIGDLEHFYSVDTMIDSDLVNAGLLVHRRWGEDDKFWQYEYHYRSSIAKALHERLRVKIGLDIPGIHTDWDKLKPEEKLAIGMIEHVRWNAYMRTEGYQFSGDKSRDSRNDLGKVHNNLVAVTELSDDDLRKDA